MRVLTFQCERVLHDILDDGVYYAESRFSRERRDYSKDIAQFEGMLPEGKIPVWCYVPVSSNEFKPSDFVDGSLFERFRCEMSLRDKLSVLPMIELEIPEELLRPGLTHNSYDGAKVFPYITKEMLVAVYRLSYDTHWFFPKVLLATSYREDFLFPEGFKCSDSED